jgi:hypothetical protein
MALSTKPPVAMLRELRDAVMNEAPEADRERLKGALKTAGAALNGRGDATDALMALYEAVAAGLPAGSIEEGRLGLAMGESVEVLVANGSGDPEWRAYFAQRGDAPPVRRRPRPSKR